MKRSTVFFGIQINRLAIFAGTFFLSMAISASAEEGKSPCADDVAKFCKDMEKSRVVQCIKDKKRANELSPACTQALDDAEKYGKLERKPEFWPACKDDATEHCKGIMPGSGKLFNCLKHFENDLDSECKDMLK